MDSLFGYQLGLFGEIDAEVVRARERRNTDDLEIIETVERLLPNTTGYGQAGWYEELQQFLRKHIRRAPHSQPMALPKYDECVQTLHSVASGSYTRTAVEAASISPAEDAVLRSAVLHGAAYPAMVLAKIDRIRNGPTGDPAGRAARAMGTESAGADRLRRPLDIVCAAGGTSTGDPAPEAVRSRVEFPRFAAIHDKLHRINERRDFVATLSDDLGPDTAAKCLTCFGMLEEVDGQYCSTIYTDHVVPKLTVDDVRRILDPRNWPYCCTFFRAVVHQEPVFTTTGWTRVLETISPEPDDYLLQTALLFYYGESQDGIYLNYDIDPSKQNDCGLVEVDSGYIWVTPQEHGVRIRTSKQERVNGLSPTATSALACHLGWGQISRDMLAGHAMMVAAKLRSPDLSDQERHDLETRYHRFEKSPPQVLPDSDTECPAAAAAPAHLPPNFGDTVADAAELATQSISLATATMGRAAARWLDGLTRKDVSDIVNEIGSNAVEVAEHVYDTAARNVRPELTRTQDGGNQRG